MPIQDFMECMAFYRLWPFGDVRRDLQMSVLASTVANSSGRYRRTMKPEDFMLFSEPQQQRSATQTPQEMLEALQRFQMAANLKQVRKEFS